MALISVGGQRSETIWGSYRVQVYVKETWGDDSGDFAGWEPADYLVPVWAVQRGIHGRSEALFKYDFGRMTEPAGSELQTVYPRKGRNCFVCIEAAPESPEGAPPGTVPHVLWCGVIPGETLDVKGTEDVGVPGEDPKPAGVQTFQAVGLEWLLERRKLWRAPVVKPGQLDPDENPEDETEYHLVDQVPSFNARLSGGGRQLSGNRSKYKSLIAGPPEIPQTYMFGRDWGDAAPYPWSHKDIIEFLLVWTDTYTGEDAGEPHFALAGADAEPDEDAMVEFLDSLTSVIRTTDANVLELIRRLIDRKRGLGAAIRWVEDPDCGLPDGTRDVQIELASLTDVPIAVGDVTLPAALQQIDAIVDEARGIATAEIRLDEVNAYDWIVVQGARMQSCFSAASTAIAPGQEKSLAEHLNVAAFAPAWTSGDAADQEELYEAANDAQRKRHEHQRTFRRFRLGKPPEEAEEPDFDWLTCAPEPEGGDPDERRALHPGFSTEGDVLVTQNGSYGNLDLRLLPRLPILDPADVAAEAAELHFLKPFALVEGIDDAGEGTERWFAAHKPPDSEQAYAPTDPTVDRPPVSADVKCLERGGAIDVKFTKANHILARNHFVPEAGAESEIEPVFDFDRMVVTVCAVTDARPRVVIATGAAGVMTQRTKIISVDDAQVWLVAPGTVVGVTDAGGLQFHAGGQVVRDDTDRLRQIAALAKVLFGKSRARLTLERTGLLTWYPLNLFVRSVQANLTDPDPLNPGPTYHDVGTVVSEVTWNFERLTTRIRTGHLELDLRR